MTEDEIDKLVEILPARLTIAERARVNHVVRVYRTMGDEGSEIYRIADVVEKLLIYHDRFVAFLQEIELNQALAE